MNQFVSNAQARRVRALWMATLETRILRLSPAHAGRIDWNAANFHFDQGRDPGDASDRMLASEPPVDRR
jgi:hypothetical protein